MTRKSLTNLHFLITAGPTREYLDPVRFLSNPSTGKMGYALATEAAKQGARVTLVLGPVGARFPRPGGETPPLRVIPVVSAQDMYRAVMKCAPKSDVIIMTAAVSDYRPKKCSSQKIKKTARPMKLELVRTPDILAALGARNRKRVGAELIAPLLVGFAAETNHVVRYARAKLLKKNLDLIVANPVTRKNSGFASDFNQVFLIDRHQKIIKTPRLPKQKIAQIILRKIGEELSE